MADETVLNCSLEWSGLKVGCNACITTHRLDYEDLEAHDDFSSYFQRLTFMCTSEKLMLYPPAQGTRKVKDVRKAGAGLLFEIPFAEIQEIGNCWPAQCRLPDSPFRTTPIRLLRCEPAYVVLKSGRVLVLEQLVSTGGTDLFRKAVCKLMTAFIDWKEKEQRDSRPTWESVAMFFTKLFGQGVTVSARERAEDCFTNFKIPLSKERAVAAAAEERRLMEIALRWLRRTERASVQEEKYRRFFRFLRRPVTPLTPTDAPYEENVHSDPSSEASGVDDDMTTSFRWRCEAFLRMHAT
uniref:Uncharacterized protein n=1 Tax=Chromera velia CCMP2878 TaxID=1169474 RepID=A0A0G4IBG0_9ALVE|eukprot:Cvel_12744.t1-p1 / transcript=Cvel_12744.t1 / gene=Cvel_12744 / organism=Chromera_velia_CCMP2878 / gene_product=hypothetical protein / transcript_product=hypothetical protein / location=Cvel_scaffold847:6618-7502(-) / protein_length=295 / sequence_SO=supercontig / SO=protein_coding / is_pseudo=false